MYLCLNNWLPREYSDDESHSLPSNTVVYRQSAPPRLSARPPLFTSAPLYFLNYILTWLCSYILLLSCLFRKLKGTNDDSLEMGIILYRHSQHDRLSHCRSVGVTAFLRQWRGQDAPSQHSLSTSCFLWPPLAIGTP